MGTSHSLNESFLRAILKGLAVILRALPYRLALSLGWLLGRAAYYFLPKKRQVAYSNLKIAFGAVKSPREIDGIVRKSFESLAQSFVDFLCIPKIKRLGCHHFVTVHGMEHVHEAMKRGKGLILLAIHSGSWELANVVGSSWGYPYNLVANTQPKTPILDVVINEYRRMTGAKIIAPGAAIRGVVKALRANEIVTLVIDQGGKEGLPVSFLGKTASMSTGAVRLALQYDTPLCPARITRRSDGQHDLTMYPLIYTKHSGDMANDLPLNTITAVGTVERLIREYPDEYLWFYKVYKYSTQSKIVILDDGRTGHLRQSQMAGGLLAAALRKRGKEVEEITLPIVFKNRFSQKIFAVFTTAGKDLRFLRNERLFSFFLTSESYLALLSHKPDYTVSCGSKGGRVNFIYARSNEAKSIHILKGGTVGKNSFDLSIIPQHDKSAGRFARRCVVTKAALNLITPEYLKAQEQALLARYPHLKNEKRLKIGVLLGGPTKGVAYDGAMIEGLVGQLKKAAKQWNAVILITTSRRTPLDVDVRVAALLQDIAPCGLCVIANQQNIPEAVGGILALSDIVVVSGESISMVSEALASGKKIIVFSPRGAPGPSPQNKYDRFAVALSEQGYLLAVGTEGIAAAINDMAGNQFLPKAFDDRAAVAVAIEEMVS